MCLKLEVVEERQTVLRCSGANRGSALPAGAGVSSLVFVERNVGGRKLNILVI